MEAPPRQPARRSPARAQVVARLVQLVGQWTLRPLRQVRTDAEEMLRAWEYL